MLAMSGIFFTVLIVDIPFTDPPHLCGTPVHHCCPSLCSATHSCTRWRGRAFSLGSSSFSVSVPLPPQFCLLFPVQFMWVEGGRRVLRPCLLSATDSGADFWGKCCFLFSICFSLSCPSGWWNTENLLVSWPLLQPWASFIQSCNNKRRRKQHFHEKCEAFKSCNSVNVHFCRVLKWSQTEESKKLHLVYSGMLVFTGACDIYT